MISFQSRGHVLVHIAIIGRGTTHHSLEGGREALQGMITELSGDANQGIARGKEQMLSHLKMASTNIFIYRLACLSMQEIHEISIAHAQWLDKAMSWHMATGKTVIARYQIIIHRSLYLLHQRSVDARASEMLAHIIATAIIKEHFYLLSKQNIGEIIQVPIQFRLDVVPIMANDGLLSLREMQRLLDIVLEESILPLPIYHRQIVF